MLSRYLFYFILFFALEERESEKENEKTRLLAGNRPVLSLSARSPTDVIKMKYVTVYGAIMKCNADCV